MSAIEVRGLTKSWGAVNAVDNVEFRVEEGEFLLTTDELFLAQAGAAGQ